MDQPKYDDIAIATLESAVTLKWYLRIDPLGLYRWYLDGTCWTNVRGSTQLKAELALRKFVEQTLQGELLLTELQKHKSYSQGGQERFDKTA